MDTHRFGQQHRYTHCPPSLTFFLTYAENRKIGELALYLCICVIEPLKPPGFPGSQTSAWFSHQREDFMNQVENLHALWKVLQDGQLAGLEAG